MLELNKLLSKEPLKLYSNDGPTPGLPICKLCPFHTNPSSPEPDNTNSPDEDMKVKKLLPL